MSLFKPFRAHLTVLNSRGDGNVVDGTGTTFRFELAACSDFKPAFGIDVDVHAIEPHPLGIGMRATKLMLASDATTYEARLAETLERFEQERIRAQAPKPLPPMEDENVELPALDADVPEGHRLVVELRLWNVANGFSYFRNVTWDGLVVRIVAGQADAKTPDVTTNEHQRTARKYDTRAEAKAAVERDLVDSGRTYKRRVKRVSFVPIAPKAVFANNDELERAFEQTHSADQARVYADWLQSHGDLRGELAARFQQGSDVALTFLRENASALLGEADFAIDVEVHSFEWTHGFLTGVSLKRAAYDSQTDLSMLTRDVLASPLGRFVTNLRFGLASYESDNDWSKTLAAIAESTRAPHLRRLAFDDYTYEDCEISWTPFGDFSQNLSKLTSLEHLHIRSGQGGEVGQLVLPRLKTFIRESGGLAAHELRAIASAKWPELERLDVWFGSQTYGAQGSVDLIQPVLDANGLPKLKHLGLINCEFSTELITALINAPILKQLSTLDVSKGVLLDADVDVLLANVDKLKHLTRIDVSENLLAESAGRLTAALPSVVVGEQREGSDDDRYCAVGE